MYTNLTCQDVSFTVATLSNILNDKHTPQKCKNRFVRYRRRGQKSVLKSLSDERAFLSCAALRMLVKIRLTKQEKRKSYQMTNMRKVIVFDNDLILLWFSPPGKPYLRQPFEVTFNRPLKVERNLLICMFG